MRTPVGNLYVNRGTTGAMVGRQPFGGNRRSGSGSKAGGPDYLLQFVEPRVVTENTMRHGFTGRRRVRHMIGAIILGLVAGYVAKALVPGKDPGGFFVTILLGLVGSLVGFFFFTELLGIGDSDIFDLGGLIGAIIGTVVVLLGYRTLVGLGRPRRRVVPISSRP